MLVKKYLIIAIIFFLGIVFWGMYCFVPVFNAPDSADSRGSVSAEKQYFKSLNIGEIKIYDRDNFLITHLSKEDGFFLEISEDEIPDTFVKSLIETEDKRFNTHWGVDIFSKIRAIKNNILSGKIVSGGSTIPEQWIKNEYFRGENRTILQKFREATLSLYFSGRLSKQEIMRNYLNSAYFGNKIYGLKSASFVYFQKLNLKSLTDSEISILLDILNVPSRAKNKYKFSGFSDTKKGYSKNMFPHVTSQVLQKPSHQKSSSVFHTQIDSTLQKKTRNFMQNQLASLRDKNVSNAAVLAFSPRTGEIFLEQGSVDFYSKEIDGQVNVIHQKRQMGSALKPFLYFLAFENGSHPEDIIWDTEEDFIQDTEISGKNSGEIYHPLNYNLTESGEVTLSHALANSLNIPAVKVLKNITPEKFQKFLEKQGLKFDFKASHYGLSLALGSPDLTMWEVAHGYAKMMKSLEGFSQSQEFLWKILSSQENRASSFGLNSVLNTSIPMMVKTGTTHNFKDNWVFAYHPDVMIAVWVGNNDSSPMKGVSGVSGAGPIFHFVAEEMNARGYFETEISDDSEYWGGFQDLLVLKTDRQKGYTSTEKIEISQKILSPKNNEIFYINPETPLELQKIIFKSSKRKKSEKSEDTRDFWILNNTKIENSNTQKNPENIFFWVPEVGKFHLQLKNSLETQEVFFEVRSF